MKLTLKHQWDFSKGVEVDPKSMHEEILEQLKNDSKLDRLIQRTGKTMVIGIKYEEEIVIHEVTEGYKSYSYQIE